MMEAGGKHEDSEADSVRIEEEKKVLRPRF